MEPGPVDLDWVAEVERGMFRTHMDLGANTLVMMTWNWTRTRLGLPPITMRNLVENYAQTDRDDIARYEAEGASGVYALNVARDHLKMLESWLSRDDHGLQEGIEHERKMIDAIRRGYGQAI